MIEIRDGWCSGSLADDTGREWPVVQHRQESSRGALLANPPNLILHTTETDGYVETLRFPSQWQVGEGKIGQHIRLGLAGDAVNEWDRVAQQIEIVGRSLVHKWLPREPSLGPLVALVAWLHRSGRIKTGLERPADWPVFVDQLPAAVPTYYRRRAGLWPSVPGVYGHIEIPDNSHWDPGGFDYPTFFARVKAVRDREDDVAFGEEFMNGSRARRAGKPLPDDATAAFEFGWRQEARIEAATKTPEPGTPAPHEHDVLGKAK